MNDIKVIQLTNGGFTVLDNEDFERFKHKKWQHTAEGYVYRNEDGTALYLHRAIMNAPPKMDVHHENGVTYDNQKRNLRICARSAHNGNQHVYTFPKTSRFKGVSFDASRGKWSADIGGGKTRLRLGRFATEEEAARAYNAKAPSLFGQLARLNPL